MKIKSLFTFLIFLFGALFVGYMIGLKNSKSQDRQVLASFKNGKILIEDIYQLTGRELYDLEKNYYYNSKAKVDEAFVKKVMDDSEVFLSIDNVEFEYSEYKSYLTSLGVDEKKLSRVEQKNYSDNYRLLIAKSAISDKINKKKKDLNFKYHLPLPTFEKVEISKGNTKSTGHYFSPVKIIYFTNYVCSQCQNIDLKRKALVEQYGKQLDISFRYKSEDPEDSFSYKLAEAALCANDQNAFWSFHEVMIKKPAINNNEIFQLASELKLNSNVFKNCFESKRHRQVVINDQVEARVLKNYFEPVFVINNQVVSGLEDIDIIKELINREID